MQSIDGTYTQSQYKRPGNVQDESGMSTCNRAPQQNRKINPLCIHMIGHELPTRPSWASCYLECSKFILALKFTRQSVNQIHIHRTNLQIYQVWISHILLGYVVGYLNPFCPLILSRFHLIFCNCQKAVGQEILNISLEALQSALYSVDNWWFTHQMCNLY